jgi:8-oxo-dGTP diphosphatase
LAHGNFDDAKADDDAKDIGVYSFDDLKEMVLAFDHETNLSDVKEHLEKN